MQPSRNVFRRHPFLTSFVILAGILFAFMRWVDLTTPPPKKLDYRLPILTGEGAIICPQSLLYDVRADHGPSAIFSAFTAISNRAEKAHALGCEEIRGGLLVTAHRMAPPYEDYVAVRIILGPDTEFFTMEGELENLKGAVPTRSADEEMEADRGEFQKAFPSLSKTRGNLRWFEDQIESGADAQESAGLVTPYGPCIEFFGNTSAGYSLLFDGNHYHDPHGKGTFVGGTYQNRLEAIHAAEDYCHNWFISERNKPPSVARDSHIWFTPEEEDETAPQPPLQPAQAPVTDPDGTQPTYLLPPTQPVPQPTTVLPPTAQQPESPPTSPQIPQTVAQNRDGQTVLTIQDHAFGQSYAHYFDSVQRTINQYWFGQEADPRSSTGKSVKLIFDINRDGTPSKIHVETSSGSPSLDLSAVHALQRVETFGPLPAGNKQTVEDTFTHGQTTLGLMQSPQD